MGDSKLPSGSAALALDHEQCSETGNKVETLDTNGDGKVDVRRIFDKSSGKEICRIADLDHDGKPDMYEYYDASGNVRRREFCYDDTGVVNAVEFYDAGKLSKREYDTTGQHKIDTWDYFDGSAPVDAKTGRPTHPTRRERDVTGDGKVDQWWTWNADNGVTIAVDSSGDGKPDPASTLQLDAQGNAVDSNAPAPAASSAAPASSAAAPAPTDSSGSSAPAASGSAASGTSSAASASSGSSSGSPAPASSGGSK